MQQWPRSPKLKVLGDAGIVNSFSSESVGGALGRSLLPSKRRRRFCPGPTQRQETDRCVAKMVREWAWDRGRSGRRERIVELAEVVDVVSCLFRHCRRVRTAFFLTQGHAFVSRVTAARWFRDRENRESLGAPIWPDIQSLISFV